MTRSTGRTCRVPRPCGCGNRIKRGERYVEHVASPDHDDFGNVGWWRLAECAECATRYGRVALL